MALMSLVSTSLLVHLWQCKEESTRGIFKCACVDLPWEKPTGVEQTNGGKERDIIFIIGYHGHSLIHFLYWLPYDNHEQEFLWICEEWLQR